MSDRRPTSCPRCGAGLEVLDRDATESHGQAQPTRIDWAFQCRANADHPPVHWQELS